MIDWNNRTIKGKSGKIYRIEPENISAGRWAEYEIQQLELSFSTNFKTLYGNLSEIKKLLTNGNNVLQALSKGTDLINKILIGIDNYTQHNIPTMVKFCSLFCIEEGEDVSRWDSEVARRKYDDWSHIPMKDFFLLSSVAIPSFQDVYNASINPQKESNK